MPFERKFVSDTTERCPTVVSFGSWVRPSLGNAAPVLVAQGHGDPWRSMPRIDRTEKSFSAMEPNGWLDRRGISPHGESRSIHEISILLAESDCSCLRGFNPTPSAFIDDQTMRPQQILSKSTLCLADRTHSKQVGAVNSRPQ